MAVLQYPFGIWPTEVAPRSLAVTRQNENTRHPEESEKEETLLAPLPPVLMPYFDGSSGIKRSSGLSIGIAEAISGAGNAIEASMFPLGTITIPAKGSVL